MRLPFIFVALFLLLENSCFAQLQWQNVDSAYGPLLPTVHVYFTAQAIDTALFRAFYLVADLKDKSLDFATDTTLNRRLTPSAFYAKNKQPLVVVNGTFFSFETNRNLNVVVKEGKLLSHNPVIKVRTGDTNRTVQAYRSAIGVNLKRRADVAWIKTDSTNDKVYASQVAVNATGNFFKRVGGSGRSAQSDFDPFSAWKVQTAIGGGPVLLQNGEVKIANDVEGLFAGKAINDKHPRTAMGYTKDNKLIVLAIEGRNENAGGATLVQEAQILKDLGCVEALNLDGGGSSCLLVNGKETIKVSDAAGQRPVPAVFLIMSNQ